MRQPRSGWRIVGENRPLLKADDSLVGEGSCDEVRVVEVNKSKSAISLFLNGEDVLNLKRLILSCCRSYFCCVAWVLYVADFSVTSQKLYNYSRRNTITGVCLWWIDNCRLSYPNVRSCSQVAYPVDRRVNEKRNHRQEEETGCKRTVGGVCRVDSVDNSRFNEFRGKEPVNDFCQVVQGQIAVVPDEVHFSVSLVEHELLQAG